MRVSTLQFYSSSSSQIQGRQRDMLRVQDQLGSGQRLLGAADDPVATQRVIRIDEAIGRVNQFARNADAVSLRLSVQEGLLSNATNALQRVRELVLQGKGGGVSNEDRRFIAVELRARLEEVLQFANGQDANGDYVFAGFRTADKPFLMSSSGQVTFVGDQGTREIPISPERQVADADSGFRVFQDIRGGNGVFTLLPVAANAGTGVIETAELNDGAVWAGRSLDVVFTGPGVFDVNDVGAGTTVASGLTYSPGEAIDVAGVRIALSGEPATGDRFEVRPSQTTPVFDTLLRTAQAMEQGFTTPAGQAAFSNAMNRSLVDIDQAMQKLLEVQASVGSRLNAIDTQRSFDEDLKLQLQSSRSSLVDLDYSEASIRLNQNLLALQAAQQAFVRTSGLNLFALL